jgi:hypothetical protein
MIYEGTLKPRPLKYFKTALSREMSLKITGRPRQKDADYLLKNPLITSTTRWICASVSSG